MSTAPRTPRMPRRERRAQLLELATGVFTRKGYQGTSMDDIAAAAGVTKPVLYQHFESKEALYGEVIAGLGRTVVTEVERIAEFSGTTEDRVRFGLRRFYDLVMLEDALRLFTGRSDISPTIQQQVDAALDRAALSLSTVLMTFRRIPDAEARRIGRALIAVAQTTASLLHDADSELEREQVLSTMTGLAVNGLSGYRIRSGVDGEGAGAPTEERRAEGQGTASSVPSPPPE